MTAADAKQIHDILSNQLIPKSNDIHHHISNFLQVEIKDFNVISRDNQKVIDQLKHRWEEYDQNINQITTKKNKDKNFSEKGAGFLKSKDDEIKAKNKNLESLTTSLKESVTKIKPEKLVKLPVPQETCLQDCFSTIYEILYNDARNNFNWKVFQEKALEHEGGEDFISRLVNINFKDMREDYFENLLKVKKDPKFDDVCLNSKYAFDIIDLADWIDYVCMGRQISEEKKSCEHEYDKIRRDIDKRSNGALQMSEKYWRESFDELQKYQNNLVNFEAEIKNLLVGMNESLSQLADVKNKRQEKIKEINNI